MQYNVIILFVSALIPLLIGFIYYSPKVFGTIWMKEAGVTEEKMKGSNMAKILLMAYVFSVMLASILISLVIHQMSVFSILANTPGINDPNSEVSLWLKDFMAKYGNNFRTFKHGALHGVISALFFAWPVIGINALFERRSARYTAIHVGYWVITLALMGGVICQWF
jgi:hypothetical protein